MDIRGIEVTNQLRSAIRAKLLELGVRYDEELPDYILVMVVNKKTRQQMYEDLCLFLEDSTSPFVDWLHDQVLKKLQKVTVAKKKSSRDLLPTVIVKQEEERKKKKTCPTTFLEDHTADTSTDKLTKVAKLPKKIEKPFKSSDADVDRGLENPQTKKSSQSDKTGVVIPGEIKLGATSSSFEVIGSSNEEKEGESSSSKSMKTLQSLKTLNSSEPLTKSSIEAEIDVKISEITSKNAKKIILNPVENTEDNKSEASSAATPKPSEKEEVDEESDEESTKKVKSSVNKPRITSVVTVKNRLEFPDFGSRNKFDAYKNKVGFESRYRKTVRGVDKHEFDGGRRNDVFGGRNTRGEDHFRRNIGKSHDFESRSYDSDRIVDIKSRLGNIRDDNKFTKNLESKERSLTNLRIRNPEKLSNSIKDRLGSGNSIKIRENLLNKKKELSLEEQRNLKFSDKERSVPNSNSSIKNRLGPVKNIFKSPDVKRRFDMSNKLLASSEDEESSNLRTDDDTDDDIKSAGAIGPVKSRIIAVKRSVPDRMDRKRTKLTKEAEIGDREDDDEEDPDEGKIASKVIVTPRPLKPLQPVQKRATQSLLLRAVAEANQSVVTQKNPEPVLMEKTTISKRPVPSGIREGQNLSVRLNSSKRLVMEKIQVELTTGESDIDNPEPYVPQPVTDEHMGVVMSLFQRSNDSQKFLVTLNGYNNNVSKEKSVSDEDERLEMEVNEEDDFLLANPNTEEYVESVDASLNGFQLADMDSIQSVDNARQAVKNSENLNVDGIEDGEEDLPRKKRKLSPIIYNRSRSSSPAHTKPIIASIVSLKHLEKNIAVETVQPSAIDKSKEKCRYWPNCTLGMKCPYYHPAVLCSAFPTCKYGEKCLYKHPKCKFGLSCTKLGCVYRHPPRQCKYHPYCTNPTCAYTHPLPQVQPVEVVTNRAKFTWRKHE